MVTKTYRCRLSKSTREWVIEEKTVIDGRTWTRMIETFDDKKKALERIMELEKSEEVR